MRIVLFIWIVFNAGLSLAQQDALFSQYSYNQFVLNPAYAGSRNSFSGIVFHRSQWVGIKDAPSVESFSLHSPINKTSLAYGINVSSERIGPSTNSAAALSLAYHIKFKNARLSFALRGGVYHAIFDKNLLTFKETNDVFNVGGRESALIPNFDFGTYFYSKRFFIGGSITHLTNEKLEFSGYPSANKLFIKPHIYLHSGYVFDLGQSLKLKPTFLLKLTESSMPNVDVGFNFLFYEKFWLGASVRNTSSINFLSEWNITDYFRIGYAYDYSINKLVEYTTGSHEVFIGFDFTISNKTKKMVSPRYL